MRWNNDGYCYVGNSLSQKVQIANYSDIQTVKAGNLIKYQYSGTFTVPSESPVFVPINQQLSYGYIYIVVSMSIILSVAQSATITLCNGASTSNYQQIAAVTSTGSNITQINICWGSMNNIVDVFTGNNPTIITLPSTQWFLYNGYPYSQTHQCSITYTSYYITFWQKDLFRFTLLLTNQFV